jgi:hypothetical protein
MSQPFLKPDVISSIRMIRITPSQRDTLIVSALAAVLSMLHTGFVFGIDNNIFHLPITAGLYDEPQFKDDAFIQSLRHFASGVWLLLDHADTHLGHTPALFLGLAWLSRLLTFTGLLCCASLVGVTSRTDKIVFSLIICITSFLEGGSFAGLGGLFLNYFTHSEIANGTILLAIHAAARGRFTAATVLFGITFFINAFIAAWLAAILGLIAASLLARSEITIRAISARILIGLMPAALLVLPVLINMFANPEFAHPFDFDYASYLRQYFADHSLVDAIDGGELLALAAVALLGLVAMSQLGAGARPLQAAYAAAILLYALGVALPAVIHSPSLLNFQLLRSGTVLHLLAGVAVAALVTRWLRDPRSTSVMFAGIAAILLSAGIHAFALCIPLIAVAPRVLQTQPRASPLLRGFGFAALAFATLFLFPLSGWQNRNSARLLLQAQAEWTTIGDWARRTTPSTAMFLVPSGTREHAPQETEGAIAFSRIAVFESVAHRRIWVDYKRGAAAMWTPSYYHVWWPRLSEVRRLTSLARRLDYASDHGIDYVIDPCDPKQATAVPLFRTEHLCVMQVASTETEPDVATLDNARH